MPIRYVSLMSSTIVGLGLATLTCSALLGHLHKVLTGRHRVNMVTQISSLLFLEITVHTVQLIV